MQGSVQDSLTAGELERFNKRGYIVLPAVFSAEEIEEMRREADRILALCVNASLATGRRDTRLDVSKSAGDPETLDVRKLQPVKDLSETFRRMSEDERLIGPMRHIMGAEPILMEEKLNYKQKVACPEFIARYEVREGEGSFPLHHDWGYYRQQGYPQSTLSSAITMDDVTSDKGPIRVIPGTHTREWPLKDPDPAHGSGILADGLFSEEDRVEVLAPAGSVMIFHSMLVHDSFPNRTRQPRRIMIYSHYPGTHSFEEDKRNRRGRELGQEVEEAYRQMVARGEYVDEFRP
jgi:ectoine hydroxylase